MRAVLNRYIPFDAISRWWYILAAGPLIGFIFRLITHFRPLNAIQKGIIVEGPPALTTSAANWVLYAGWKDDALFVVLGFFLASSLIWLLEEIRSHTRTLQRP
jgi:hypothetical protein